ncbi:uncharacterized protein LOC108890106 isoform X8 [Lates calcarifer]|uniref:Uncharacterized protein LOC108890106 isoform X8 n=1 Tax=Lates calcarifer TaxID=8187 RepID=A0AAJ7PZ98_LATCA|nr:uncharacterized protein LOC108890106 isoform X8 [Lates calcarifer]
MSFTIVTALLLSSFSWISISVSESQTVEVQSGEEATLLCSNFTTSPSQIIWFRLTNRTQPRCISSIYTATDPASLCSGVQEGKYEMRSNISTVFLKMKDVDSSDSGLYFCGYYISRHPVIVSATYLKVQEELCEITSLLSVILSGVTVVLTKVIISLVVKMRRHTGTVGGLSSILSQLFSVITISQNAARVSFNKYHSRFPLSLSC